MSIITKIGYKLLKPLIIRGIEDKMKEIPVGDIFQTVWPTISKWGAKFFIALAGIVALAAMAYLKIPFSEYMALPGIVIISVAFFAFRGRQEKGVGKAQEGARRDILASRHEPVNMPSVTVTGNTKPGDNGNGGT